MKRMILFIFILLATSSCDQLELNKYEFKWVENKLMRFNKKTGEMIVLSGNEITKIDNEFIREKTREKEAIHKTKQFNNRAFPSSRGFMKSDLSIKWRDNKILYRYTISPCDNKVEKVFREGLNSITIILVDSDMFEVKSIKVYLDSLTRIVDDEGGLISCTYEESTSCGGELYQLINDVKYQWVFSDELNSAIQIFSKQLENENKSLNIQLSASIKNGEVNGTIKNDDSYVIKYTNGEELKFSRDESFFIKYVLENKEEFKVPIEKAKQSDKNISEPKQTNH